jgi:hypothetical protein
VRLNLSSFFREERSRNPNFYGDVARLLKAELVAIFTAAGFAVVTVDGETSRSARRVVLRFVKPSGDAEASKPACECTCGKCCHHKAAVEPPIVREVPEGVLTAKALNARLRARANVLAADIVAKVEANNYNNPQVYVTSTTGDLEFDMTDILASDAQADPVWTGGFDDLQVELKRIFRDERGFRAVHIARRERTWKPDRFLLQLKRPL